MLNLPIAMPAFMLLLVFLFQDLPVAVTSPQPGEELRGLVQIQGRMDAPNFASAELAFTFAADASDPAAGWFVIQTFSQPAANPVIAEWDTTAVTDDDFALRLRVFFQDGTFQDALVADLKIRNKEPLPTNTTPPTLADFNFQSPGQSPGSPAESTPTPLVSFPTATPMPVNPASLTTSSILTVFWQSALAVLVFYVFFLLILRLRKN